MQAENPDVLLDLEEEEEEGDEEVDEEDGESGEDGVLRGARREKLRGGGGSLGERSSCRCGHRRGETGWAGGPCCYVSPHGIGTALTAYLSAYLSASLPRGVGAAAALSGCRRAARARRPSPSGG